MNDRGATSVLSSKVKLGVDASAAAGPKGRSAAAATDVVMRAEMLSYSRSRGLFAGVSLGGLDSPSGQRRQHAGLRQPDSGARDREGLDRDAVRGAADDPGPEHALAEEPVEIVGAVREPPKCENLRNLREPPYWW